jgi:hypothetical protein
MPDVGKSRYWNFSGCWTRFLEERRYENLTTENYELVNFALISKGFFQEDSSV